MKNINEIGEQETTQKNSWTDIVYNEKIDQNNLFLTKLSAKILKGAHEQPHFCLNTWSTKYDNKMSLILLSYLADHVFI